MHYPLVAQVGKEGFAAYEAVHSNLITPVVGRSPNGKVIACTLQNNDAREEFMTAPAFDVATGDERAFSGDRWWRVTALTWLSDGSGLAVVAMEQMSGFSQLWELAWPGGERRRLTHSPVN
jgi:hypothetical protein